MSLANEIAEALAKSRHGEEIPAWVDDAVREMLREEPLSRAEILILAMARQKRMDFGEYLKHLRG